MDRDTYIDDSSTQICLDNAGKLCTKYAQLHTNTNSSQILVICIDDFVRLFQTNDAKFI